MSTRLEEYDGAAELTGEVIFEPGWYLLALPPGEHARLLELLEPLGERYQPAGRPHVSITKDEAPDQNQGDYGTAFVGELVTVRCSGIVRDENGLHFWVDCHSGRLCEMREHFGLVTLKRDDGVYPVNFHVTIGRRKKALAPPPRRPQLRLTRQSHIDVETGMQHL